MDIVMPPTLFCLSFITPPSHPFLLSAQVTIYQLSLPISLHFLQLCVSGILRYILFAWLHSFRIVVLRCIHVIACHVSIASSSLAVSLHGYIIICVSTHLLMDIWIVSSLGLLQTKLLQTFMCKSLCGYILSFL